MERHFDCTACGKCCYGQLPLTIGDALAHADIFPLFVSWTPVRQGGRSFDVTADLGLTVKLKNRKKAALRISPCAYLPPSMACPKLADDGLCGIHATKPQRCRTMPFSAYRDEADQEDLMLPRAGWDCDIADTAPLYYQDKHCVERTAFDTERAALIADARILKPYGDWLLEAVPTLRMDVMKAAMKPAGGQRYVSFSTLVPRLAQVDIYDFAAKQAPVMRHYADQTASTPDLAPYHKRYAEEAERWEKVVAQKSGA